MDDITASENYTVTMLERLDARGSREAIVAGERRISGAEAARTVLRFAAALRDLGLRHGDGVALFVENSAEALLLELAVHFAGFRLVFVPPEPGNSELEALVRRSGARVLLFDPVFEERTRHMADLAEVEHVLAVGQSSIADDFLAAAAGATPLPLEAAADGSGIATLLYTGGTTGQPKLVTHREGYYATLRGILKNFAEDEVADPRLLIATLLTHTSGHLSSLVALLTGQTVVLQRTFDAGTALSLMESERITAMTVVTPMLYELLDHPDCGPGRFPALRTLYYGGSAAAPSRLRQAIECFGPVLHQVYGASEDGLVTELTPEEHDERLRPDRLSSCGRPAPGIEVELRDEEGKPVPTGQTGELFVRSALVMEGYWADPERTAEVLDEDGWFRSGDLARRDEDGYLYLVGRVRDIIVTGRTADNVYSRLLDDFVTALPAVRDAAAIGLPGEDGSETVHVALVPADPGESPDLDRVSRQIVEALGDLYEPASYSVTDSLPRTTVGKVDKRALREALLAQRA